MRSLILLVLFLAVSPLQAEVYKWVDADGNVHFTDQPQPGAKRFELSEPTVYSSQDALSPRRDTLQDSGRRATPQPLSYQSLTISSPAHDASIRSNEGSVSVNLAIEPALASGHKFRVYLDGSEVSSGLTTTSLELMNVDRGTHELHATVVDSSGRELIRSRTVTFHLLKISILNRPNSPSTPAN